MPLGANKAAIMGVAGVSTGDVGLLSSQTASGDSELDFTGLMTSTYGEYIFKFYNINPTANGGDFMFQVNATDGADYNDSAITSTAFYAKHRENDATPVLGYLTGDDQAQGTAFQILNSNVGSADDATGELHIFNPASTTYVKHFSSRVGSVSDADEMYDEFAAGYINDTTAVDDIRFKMSSGDFDGKIKMWGVK